MIRPRGVVSKLYPVFVGYIACEHSFTGTLLGRASLSLTKRHIQSHLRGASHRASLECLVYEARRRSLLFEARLR